MQTLIGLSLSLSRIKVTKELNLLSQTKLLLQNLRKTPIQWKFLRLLRLRSNLDSSPVQPNEDFRVKRIQPQFPFPIEMLRAHSTDVLLRIPTWPHASAIIPTRNVINTRNLRSRA